MQTRQTRGFARSAGGLRRSAATAALAALLALSACTAPRIDGRAEAEQRPSPCESALYAALGHDAVADADNPDLIRYMALRSAWGEWLDVAANCPTRFDEGVLRGARAAARAAALDVRWGVDPSSWDAAIADAVPGGQDGPADGSSDALDALASAIDASAASLAEDRAGFAVELLAARDAGGATLALSDRHKAAAQYLASSGDGDGRLKVYDVAAVLADPESTVDQANGLRAPTLGVIEMDCVRSLIAAADDAGPGDSGTAGDAGSVGDSVAADGSDNDGAADDVTANGPDDADDADGGSVADGAAGEAIRTAALHDYATLAASHAYQAFRSGYPSFDEALFAQAG